MDTKLKYLYFLPISAACVISSCTSDTSDTPDNKEESKGAEILFAVSNLTRSSQSTPLNKFALYGDMKFAADKDAAPLVIFNKKEVEYINNEWTYEGTQYWFPKHEHSFIAIHPLSILESANDIRYLNSQLSFIYTIPTTGNNEIADYRDIPDILVATHRRLYSEDDTNTTTTFTFGHVMSKINIAPALDDNIMSEDEYIKVYHVEFSGFKTRAGFSIMPASIQTNSQTDDRVIEVAGQEKEGNLTVVLPEPAVVLNNRVNVNLFDGEDAIIMLPQAFTADSNAKIIITYSINDDPTKKKVILPLMGKTWETGKSYTYKFTINRRGLHSETTSITNWDNMEVGNIDAR